MKKKDAIEAINNSPSLEEKFKMAYDVLEHSPPISQDKMLMLYAFYKQAVFGNYIEKDNKGDVSNYIQTFKNNAWSQVKDISKADAMKKYIDFTIEVVRENYKD
jgi:acyl-CoA-binding protein